MGSGCATCENLYEKIKRMANEEKINASVEYSSDINDLINEGIMGSPAILIDGKVVKVGNPSEEELNKILGIK
ncbi:MAG: thioredoxin family protein [Candidatus Methanofastidiosum sp.]|nr:thioredoxin family protein [Methanofastidiosum sp.]